MARHLTLVRQPQKLPVVLTMEEIARLIAAPPGRVNGCEDPRIDGVRRNRDEISTAVGSMLFAGKEKRGGMGETVLGSLKFLLAEATGS
jgi:hypothetical protein